MRLHRAVLAACFLVIGLLSSPGRAAGEGTFTIAAIPDAQQEITGPRFANRMQWLVDNRAALNLQLVVQVGDMMNWDTPEHEQFAHQEAGVRLLDAAGIPYVFAIGNHDTAAVKEGGSAAPGNVNQNLRNTSTYNRYFPTSRFVLLRGTWEEGKIDNAFHTFRAGGLDWLIVNLELWARAEPIAWAGRVIQEHPHHNVIIVTHAHMTGGGRIQPNNGGYGDTSAQAVFEQLMAPYANVRMVLCGHAGSHGHRVDRGTHGNPIHQFLQCYHDNRTNPTRLLEIDTAAGTIASRVYCPYTNETKEDGSTFTVTGMDWVQPAAAPPPEPGR